MNSKKLLKINDLEKVFEGRKSGAEYIYRFFSVLVPVVEKDGKLYLLYNVRAQHMERQPGEICFPGGEIETGETPKECAIRETFEEIGINKEDIRIISQLDTVYTYSNFLMHCFLGVVNEDALNNLNLNPDEVEEVFLISLDELMEMEPEVYKVISKPQIPEDFPFDRVTGGEPYKWRGGRSIVPIYDIDGRVIWGLTARITKRMIEALRDGLCSK